MASVNLRHLHTFGEVARLGSVSAAARAVHISQPAVTQAVAGVERYFGASLAYAQQHRRRADGGRRAVRAPHRALHKPPARRRCGADPLPQLRFRRDPPDALRTSAGAQRSSRAPQLQPRRARAARVATERAPRRARARTADRRAAVREDELRHHADARGREAGTTRTARLRGNRAGSRRSACAERWRIGPHRDRRDAARAQLPGADRAAGIHAAVSRAQRRDRRRHVRAPARVAAVRRSRFPDRRTAQSRAGCRRRAGTSVRRSARDHRAREASARFAQSA